MKRLLLLPFFLLMSSQVNAHTMAEYHEKINPLTKDAVLYPFQKIEDASNWRSYCVETTQKTNDWLESYIDWAGKKLRKEGKSIFFVKGYTETIRKMQKRKYSGCDCIIEKRIIALDTLSEKAADALYESQENQCFDNQ